MFTATLSGKRIFIRSIPPLTYFELSLCFWHCIQIFCVALRTVGPAVLFDFCFFCKYLLDHISNTKTVVVVNLACFDRSDSDPLWLVCLLQKPNEATAKMYLSCIGISCSWVSLYQDALKSRPFLFWVADEYSLRIHLLRLDVSNFNVRFSSFEFSCFQLFPLGEILYRTEAL